MSGVDCQAPSLLLIHYLKGRGSVKKRTPLYLAILGAFVLIFVEIARYSYINRGLMRQENVSHLQASYAQVARTFALFAERNWKLLDEWDSDLPNQFYNLTSEEAWSVIRDKAARWQYSELYMFNQNGEYSSVSGRHGISPHKESVFMAIYDENRPVLTSYPSTDGARKVVFAKPIRTPVLMEGSTYTGLAVTFRNDVLEKTISVSLYDGASDCYMVKRDGTVVLSLESQTEFDGLHGNILDFVDDALAVSRSEKAEAIGEIQRLIEETDCQQPIDVKQETEALRRRMTQYGAFIRSQEGVETALRENRAQQSRLSRAHGLTDKRRLPDFFRLRELLIAQFVYLSAIDDYIRQIGVSRNSYLVYNKNGTLPHEGVAECFRNVTKQTDTVRLQEIVYDRKTESCRVTWRPVRGLPDSDQWFETAWKKYREGDTFHRR